MENTQENQAFLRYLSLLGGNKPKPIDPATAYAQRLKKLTVES